jgi:hypothetical protein
VARLGVDSRDSTRPRVDAEVPDKENRERPAMWPSFWLYPMMPWVIATQLPAMLYAAWLAPPPSATASPPLSAKIIPFPVRRAAAG